MAERLIEAVARALWADRHPDRPFGSLRECGREDYMGHARAVLEAIDTVVDEQGNIIAWIAPWEATAEMVIAGDQAIRRNPARIPQTLGAYEDMRDACLAERRRKE